ncbi:hypothetical protein [Jannaschia sp. CCS1]|uniref:hypothetical protein n=1 Tax=Jannaschia sp. (strain CCS1) TaxID=290400 RepID=UPI000053A277|nr:hypothetical protein [Jannaschia sp. CCS1]ABD55656.1 hypothetical protein Jann_2739 [Jannaschia sp. CCS1]
MAALLCLPSAAIAQSDLSAELADTLAPVAEVESLGATLTCTALYRSLSLLFGSQSENFEDFQSREGAMASLSGVLWARSPDGAGQSPDDVFAVLLPLINAATDQYLAHMDALSLIDGTPFDDQLLGQIDYCNAIFDSLDTGAE